MEYTNHITSTRSRKHLNYAERFYIEQRTRAKCNITRIAQDLKRSRTTIYSELKRGTVVQIKQGESCLLYCADAGQIKYEQMHSHSISHKKVIRIGRFLDWVEERFIKDGWSVDSTVGHAKRMALFKECERACTKTIYNYIHQASLSIRPIDLPLIVKRSQRKAHTRQNKKRLGASIDERPSSIDTREEFGHWEIDTVRGTKNKNDQVLVTLIERKTRLYVVLQSQSGRAEDVKCTLETWLSTFTDSENLKNICKSITSDNGSEFSTIAELASDSLDIYFAHPYSSWERGSNERHNGLLRRFIPKGMPISTVSESLIRRAMRQCNNLPRKILGYKNTTRGIPRRS